MNYYLRMCWSFCLFQISSFDSFKIWGSQKSVYWKNVRKFCCLESSYARKVRMIGSLVTPGCIFLCWIEWYFWKISMTIIKDSHMNKYHFSIACNYFSITISYYVWVQQSASNRSGNRNFAKYNGQSICPFEYGGESVKHCYLQLKVFMWHTLEINHCS